jgi:hypothetical protein
MAYRRCERPFRPFVYILHRARANDKNRVSNTEQSIQLRARSRMFLFRSGKHTDSVTQWQPHEIRYSRGLMAWHRTAGLTCSPHSSLYDVKGVRVRKRRRRIRNREWAGAKEQTTRLRWNGPAAAAEPYLKHLRRARTTFHMRTKPLHTMS